MAYNEFIQDDKIFLGAVNVLLQTIGENPLESEDDIDEVLEAQIAASVIVETKREILSDGWDFNTDDNYTMSPDTQGYISIAYNMLDISDATGDVVSRNSRLYSKRNQSERFEDAKDVSVIWDMVFASLMHPLRNYITIAASRKFQARQVMDKQVYAYTQADEDTARIIARRSDGRTSKPNMYSSSYGQSYMVDGRL